MTFCIYIICARNQMCMRSSVVVHSWCGISHACTTPQADGAITCHKFCSMHCATAHTIPIPFQQYVCIQLHVHNSFTHLWFIHIQPWPHVPLALPLILRVQCSEVSWHRNMLLGKFSQIMLWHKLLIFKYEISSRAIILPMTELFFKHVLFSRLLIIRSGDCDEKKWLENRSVMLK